MIDFAKISGPPGKSLSSAAIARASKYIASVPPISHAAIVALLSLIAAANIARLEFLSINFREEHLFQ
jgi:hypothetical protein